MGICKEVATGHVPYSSVDVVYANFFHFSGKKKRENMADQ